MPGGLGASVPPSCAHPGHPVPGEEARRTGGPAQSRTACVLVSSRSRLHPPDTEEGVGMTAPPQTLRTVTLHCLPAPGIGSKQGSRSLSLPLAPSSLRPWRPGLQRLPLVGASELGPLLPERKAAEATRKHDASPNCPLWPHPLPP